MYVILAYDVVQKRNKRVSKICLKYLQRVQNSVYEGFITKSALFRLKRELQGVVVTEEDTVLIYKLEDHRSVLREEIGQIDECAGSRWML